MIGELKDEDSPETLLRAIVEAKTYQLKIQRCTTSLKRYTSCYAPGLPILPERIQSALLIFSGEKSQPWNDYSNMKNDSWLRLLITRWNMMIFVVVPAGNSGKRPHQVRKYYLKRLI